MSYVKQLLSYSYEQVSSYFNDKVLGKKVINEHFREYI